MSQAATQGQATVQVRLPPGSFRRVELRDPTNWVHLIAEPGASAALSVEGPREMARRVRAEVTGGTLRVSLAGSLADKIRDALTTSLTRRRLTVRLQAPGLVEVAVQGLVQVTVDAFGADRPVVRPLGPMPPLAPLPGSPFEPRERG